MNILYFASMRELTGLSHDTLDIEDPTVHSIKAKLALKYPEARELLDSCMIAVDGEYQYD